MASTSHTSGRPPSATAQGVEYQRVGAPMWLVVLATIALLGSVALLALRSFVPSLAGLGLTAAVLVFISMFRYLVILGEANPEFVLQPWQTRLASVILSVNFVVSIGHAYFIAVEVGKRWA